MVRMADEMVRKCDGAGELLAVMRHFVGVCPYGVRSWSGESSQPELVSDINDPLVPLCGVAFSSPRSSLRMDAARELSRPGRGAD